MKTYILKRDVYNNIDFEVGAIIKPINEQFYCFEVVEGDHVGEKGQIADGLSGYVVEDNKKNRTLIKMCLERLERLTEKLNETNNRIINIPDATNIQLK